MAGLNDLIRRLERMGAAEVKERIAAKVRDAMHAEAVRGFNEQRDPYGAPWASRKDSSGNWPILQKTGAMLRSLTARATANSVVMRILGYARFHQSGTSKMPARMIFPDPARGLGTWSEPVHRAAVEAVRELMN